MQGFYGVQDEGRSRNGGIQFRVEVLFELFPITRAFLCWWDSTLSIGCLWLSCLLLAVTTHFATWRVTGLSKKVSTGENRVTI